jgi:hypothetical protein
MTVAGKVTLNRSPGDLLITYDFTNGGGKPVLGLNRWLVSATNPTVPGVTYPTPGNVCLSSNSFPCWGDHLTLSGTISEGATNNRDAVIDPIGGFNACPGSPATCPAGTFGEAGINLTGAGVFNSTRCTTFSSAFLKSRASASFPAEVKDFVAPIPTEISNCGEVTIIKHTDPRGVDKNFHYDWNVTGTTTTDLSSTPCPTGTNGVDAFTLNDTGNSGGGDSTGNTENCFNVVAGSGYTVTEETPPSGFQFESLVDGGSTGGASCTQASSGSLQGNITVTVGGHAICLYTNKQQLGAIKITKTAKNKILGSGDQPQQGVTFTITGPGGFSDSEVTNSSGQICVQNLAFGSYTVTEIVPDGYRADSTNPQTVGVSTNGDCSSGFATATFHNTPLSQIRVTYHSKAGVGVTTATVQCTGEDPAVNLPDGLTGTGHTLDDLPPGTYTCTVIIDP